MPTQKANKIWAEDFCTNHNCTQFGIAHIYQPKGHMIIAGQCSYCGDGLKSFHSPHKEKLVKGWEAWWLKHKDDKEKYKESNGEFLNQKQEEYIP